MSRRLAVSQAAPAGVAAQAHPDTGSWQSYRARHETRLYLHKFPGDATHANRFLAPHLLPCVWNPIVDSSVLVIRGDGVPPFRRIHFDQRFVMTAPFALGLPS